MARKHRIEYEGAFYHVITRGNQKQKVFKSTGDFQKYLTLLASYKQRYHFCLYAYVLMRNHIHLLIETCDTALSKILQGINQSYTMYFNKKYRTVGHLFQGRYKAILCDRDRYLLELLKYIHNNPLRAGLAKTLAMYHWSSHRAYLAGTDVSGLVDTEPAFQMFSEYKDRARKHYEAFMNDGVSVKKQDVYATIDQRLLGDEKFIEHVREKYGGEVRRERKKKEYTLAQICAAVEKRYLIALAELRSWSRRADLLRGRQVISLIAKEYGYTGREIAAFLNKDPAAVTGYLRQRNGLGIEVNKMLQEIGRGQV
jgi:REP element-mobilizing transposase RayT